MPVFFMAEIKSFVTTPTNIDRVVDRILNDPKMTPAKIKALSSVIQSLKGVTVSSPNEIEETSNEAMLSEEQPIDISEVTGVSIDGEKARNVKIYKTGIDG